jgi:hypothetical protein
VAIVSFGCQGAKQEQPLLMLQDWTVPMIYDDSRRKSMWKQWIPPIAARGDHVGVV